MTEDLKLAVFTDAPPISESVLATGMCRVNTQLFLAVSDHIETIVSTTLGGTYCVDDIDHRLRDRATLIDIPKPMRLITKAAGKFIEPLRSENISFRLNLPTILKKIDEKSVNWLFCSCGVDPSVLGRGFHLAQRSGLPLAIYLVDDFLDGAILSGNKQHLAVARQSVPYWLKKVDKIFVISEGLRQHLKKKYDVESIVLPLPYAAPDSSDYEEIKIEKQVVYLGGLSHFYIDGLRQLAQAIDFINNNNKQKILLTIISGVPLSRIKSLLGDYEFIRSKSCISADAVRKEISRSAVCFLPYSFHDKYRVMVSTSFPSKMMDYLAAGRSILVYGPKYSSSVNYFNQHSLPEILSTEDPELLKQMLINKIYQPLDHTACYIASLLKHHSYSKISEIIVNNIATRSSTNGI
jgi:hypothetical protein